MIAITLGFTANGRNAEPTVLYCGNDATAAEAAQLNPPSGTIRTELLKNPIGRRRYFPAPAAPAPAEEKSTAPAAPKKTSPAK